MEVDRVSDLVDWAETVIPDLPPLPEPVRYVWKEEDIVDLRNRMKIQDSFNVAIDGVNYTLMYKDPNALATGPPLDGRSVLGETWYFHVGLTLLEIPPRLVRDWEYVAKEIYIELKTQEMNKDG